MQRFHLIPLPSQAQGAVIYFKPIRRKRTAYRKRPVTRLDQLHRRPGADTALQQRVGRF